MMQSNMAKVKTPTLPGRVSEAAETPYEELQTTANQLNYENLILK